MVSDRCRILDMIPHIQSLVASGASSGLSILQWKSGVLIILFLELSLITGIYFAFRTGRVVLPMSRPIVFLRYNQSLGFWSTIATLSLLSLAVVPHLFFRSTLLNLQSTQSLYGTGVQCSIFLHC